MPRLRRAEQLLGGVVVMQSGWRVAMLVVFLSATMAESQSLRVTKAEESRWLRWVIPLPKQIRIEKKVKVNAADVRVIAVDNAGELAQAATKELTGLIREKSGAESRPGKGKFEILVGVCDASGCVAGVKTLAALGLKQRPNPEQAYVIQPVAPNRLLLTGLTEKGVYYAAQTLKQLLEGQFAEGTVTIPLATVNDWPDLAERGEWGGSSTSDIEWFAQQKMNLVEAHIDLSVDAEGKGVAKVNPKLLEQARLHALNFVPIITHLEQIEGTGLFVRFPELKGKGDPDAWKRIGNVKPACFSQPKLQEIMADWLTCLARYPEVSDVCVWLSENDVQCACDRCQSQNQFALETRVALRAWEAAKAVKPSLGLRILLTQGSYRSNDKVLAMVPPEVGISYYHGGLTYDSTRNPMIDPLLADYAAKGRWLGCYPQLTASWRIVCPWSGAQFIKARMNEFVDKKLQCLCGYATPNNRFYEFNVTAAAEWSWNAKGRDEREFAAAWATRQGLKDPDAVAEWAVMLGPVGWDVYGSGIPYPAFFGGAAQVVASHTRPTLGQGMFRYFPSRKHIEEDLAACAKALTIAKRIGDARLTTETQVIGGYVQMVKEINGLCAKLSSVDMTSDPERRQVQDSMCRLAKTGAQTASALREWERSVGQGLGGSRFQDSIMVTEQTVSRIGKTLAVDGIQDPGKPYRRQEIGKWESNDFEKNEGIRKTWEVTECVSGTGRYEVDFAYTSGWHGLYMRRVALATAPKDKPESLTDVAKDEHQGVAACQNKDNVYRLVVATYDPALRYFVLADIRGVRSSDKPENRRGCCGVVSIVKSGPDSPIFEVPNLLPITDEGRARYSGPRFSGKGLRVGIVMNGYGSASCLEVLKKSSGMDAQAIYRIEKSALDLCQVVVMPQPRAVEVFGEAQAKLLRDFVANGGGLIATHDAVGYRGLPPIVPEVCEKGLAHVRDSQWVAALDHPVTRGIEVGVPLPHSYYDHIELQPGPHGVVVAKAQQSGRPVAICGDTGKGRYVACGLAIGLDASDEDAAPTRAEKTLLENAVRWAGTKE
ncbi:MAG: hypothetical protein COZ56_03945 [Armatimonadetes bacterium CG_4_8_14_3_um_filter_58_9]|nr:MAG: hypothetical protein COZ56_03945 [Armatimonadetes bacterium CG_4_8_14_3_um_filter_58_9]